MKQIDLNNEIVIYQSEDGKTQLDVKLEGETVWLTQTQMSELFQTDRTVINRHIRNIYKSGELEEEATCAKNAQVRIEVEGNRTVSRSIPYYNLDMIISVGYRVNSIRGVRFRQWANSVLKQYLIKGYAVNERIRKQQISELRQLVQVLGRTLQQQPVPTTDESNALFVWLLPSLRQREGRLFQELHRADLSDLRRCGSLSQCRRKSSHATLSRHQESFLQ